MPTVRELRESQGLSREQLAAKASVSAGTIFNMENEKAVTKATLIMVSGALGVNPEEIVGVVVLNRVLKGGRVSE